MADTLSTLDKMPDGPNTYGVLGDPVAHSLSPGFQRAGFAALGKEVCYEKVQVSSEDLPAVVAKLREKKWGGWNCTLPHKIHMLDLVDEVADSARKLGAINTVVQDEGKLIGFNTDGEGWVQAIRDVFQVDIRDLTIMILGLGGAGSALATQAALEKCERLVVVNRTWEKAQHFVEKVKPLFASEKLMGPSERCCAIPWEEDLIAQELDRCHLLVNATSVGLRVSDPALLPSHLLQPHLLVFDTIYRPATTRLLADASQNGARVANGLSMLLHQGAAALRLWTGRSAPLEVMRQALEAEAHSLA